jgi:UDPglucose 6-dehydrogenase
MKIAMIGVGYVGLVSGACLAEFGHEVVCVDKQRSRIDGLNKGVMPIYEPGLDSLVARGVETSTLTFTTELAQAVTGADAVFIAVGTPSRRGDGHADLGYVYAAVEEVADALTGPSVIVLKSTVPVGTNRSVAEIMAERRPDLTIDVASNPEFLREGAAIEDFMRPDRIIVGAETDRARAVMADVYRPLALREAPVLFMSLESAELTKYAANAFLATKISFINEIANLCEHVGADVQQVAKGIGTDRRIGPKFLHPGPGYGGSCFPKDTLALARTAQMNDSPLRLVETVIAINDQRKREMAARILEALDDSAHGKRVAVFGVTFKPETDDMRESPSLVIVPALIGAGATVTVCDPQGEREGRDLLPGVTWETDPYRAAAGADALIVLTEWNLFRGLSLPRLHDAMNGDVLVDLRNIYDAALAVSAGFRYQSVGRPNRLPEVH